MHLANRHLLLGQHSSVYICISLIASTLLVSDRKEILPVKISYQQCPKILIWETFGRLSLT